MLKLALRNLKSKPWRTVATVLAIAVAVAMIFAMLSFRGTVSDYIGATETAVAGNSDIKIATQSSSDRITTVTSELENLKIDDVDENGLPSKRAVDMDIIASLYLYAELGGEYVQARGFETGKLDALQKIEVVAGSVDALNVDDVVISEKAATHFGLGIGDELVLKLGANSPKFYVAAIAKNTGYFLADSPYLVLGNIKRVSALVLAGESSLCNEIYVKINDGSDVNAVIDAIKNIEQYKNMQVGLSHDYRYIDEQTTSLTAPVVLAGAAVLVLAVAIVAFIFIMSEKDKIDYIARLKIVGATNGQLVGIFLVESAIIAFVGGLAGSALAVGTFAIIVRLTLKISLASVSAIYLFAAAAVGIVTAVVSSLLPIARSVKGSIRQNQVAVKKENKFAVVLPISLCVLLIVSVIVECLVQSVSAYFGIVSLVLALGVVFFGAPYALKGVAKLAEKSKNPSVKIASKTLPREKRFARSTSILAVGMLVSVLLFMAWSITTSVFDGYIKNFENFVFVSNIKSTVDVDGIKAIDGVENATKMVWQKSEIKGDGFEKTVNLLGSGDIIEMINFEFITSKEEVKVAFASNDVDKAYTDELVCLADISLEKLYGTKLGDELDLTVKDKTVKVKIAGFVQHNLFNGNYIIVSSEALEKIGVDVDTVLVISSGDVDRTVGNVKQKYASQNYYVVSALEAFKWDKESSSAVFDLVGTLAVVVCAFIIIVSVFAALVGRSTEERGRTAMLAAGMSKGSLLKAEAMQHIFIAILAFVVVFAFSALATMSLIHALGLFGLYFDFVYTAWVVGVSGLAMSLAYALVPFVLNFKRGYKLKRD